MVLILLLAFVKCFGQIYILLSNSTFGRCKRAYIRNHFSLFLYYFHVCIQNVLYLETRLGLCYRIPPRQKSTQIQVEVHLDPGRSPPRSRQKSNQIQIGFLLRASQTFMIQKTAKTPFFYFFVVPECVFLLHPLCNPLIFKYTYL